MVTVFLSYSWDSDTHKTWVARLGARLRAVGLTVRLDQTDLRPGSDLTKYMESSVRESDFVVLICTPEFAARADQRIGGVGYEQTVVTGELFGGVGRREKFIPILRGDPENSVPSFLRGQVWVDFRSDAEFQGALSELLSAFGTSSSQPSASSHEDEGPSDEDLIVYKQAFALARSKTGLAKRVYEAEEFAEWCKENWSLKAFRVFEEVFQFAKSSMKLPRGESEGFAFEWMDRDELEHFAEYRDAYEFAVSKTGFNLRPYQGREWVKEFDDQHGMEFFGRFWQAFEVARESGQSRSKAEDFAFENLLSGSG